MVKPFTQMKTQHSISGGKPKDLYDLPHFLASLLPLLLVDGWWNVKSVRIGFLACAFQFLSQTRSL